MVELWRLSWRDGKFIGNTDFLNYILGDVKGPISEIFWEVGRRAEVLGQSENANALPGVLSILHSLVNVGELKKNVCDIRALADRLDRSPYIMPLRLQDLPQGYPQPQEFTTEQGLDDYLTDAVRCRDARTEEDFANWRAVASGHLDTDKIQFKDVCNKCGVIMDEYDQHKDLQCSLSIDECTYPYCTDRTNHVTYVCPTLHSRCSSCYRRGHCEEQHWTVPPDLLRTVFETWALQGHYTILPYMLRLWPRVPTWLQLSDIKWSYQNSGLRTEGTTKYIFGRIPLIK
jgi:hypothetical protein